MRRSRIKIASNYIATELGLITIVSRTLAESPESRTDLNAAGWKGRTSLHVAALRRYNAIASKLWAAENDLDA